jgi:RNA polymerase sigma-70 factor (ECF subfamily)
VTPPPDPTRLAAHLFESHGTAVRRYLRRMTQGSAVADDLTQEVFLRIARASDRYEHRERERAWLFRIARNVWLDHRRRNGRGAEFQIALDCGAPAAHDLRLTLNDALARLPELDREAFLLSEVSGLTYHEIADLQETTVAAVRSRIYRARLALREMLSPLSRPHVFHAFVHKRESDD